ncbi:SDR family oxidoreductase, partial [Streptomyces sp. SID10116]|nr:SDR family oxidoreductase [Streptomyces sp. SID10116]
LVAYLASPAAAYTTGTSILVDGGMALSAAVANAAHAGTV